MRWTWRTGARWIALRRFLLGSALFMAGIAGLIAWAAGGGLEPGEREGEVRQLPGVSSDDPDPKHLVVMSWNIAYARGTNPDNSANERAPRATFERRLREMGVLAREKKVDLLLLQEVDFDARRSHHLDQLTMLAKHAGLAYVAPVVSWRARWVPHPPWPPSKHYGPVVSGGGVLSRFPIDAHRVLLYPKPRENSFVYNLFYLYRYSQFLRLRVAGHEIQLVNSHLEAFKKQNRMAQARALAGEVAKRTAGQGPLMLVGGDLNSAPPEAQKKHGFVDSPEDDYRDDQTLPLMRAIPGLRELVPTARYAANERAYFTFPTLSPTRRLDYLFHDERLKLLRYEFLETRDYSDHRPVLAIFELP